MFWVQAVLLAIAVYAFAHSLLLRSRASSTPFQKVGRRLQQLLQQHTWACQRSLVTACQWPDHLVRAKKRISSSSTLQPPPTLDQVSGTTSAEKTTRSSAGSSYLPYRLLTSMKVPWSQIVVIPGFRRCTSSCNCSDIRENGLHVTTRLGHSLISLILL